MEEVAAGPRRVHDPCLLNIAQGGRTKVSGLRDAGEMGYKVAISPMLLFTPTLAAAADTRLELTAIRDQLDTLLDQAGRPELNLREALSMLCAAEAARKDERRVQMGMSPRVYPGGALDRAAAGALLKSLKNVLGKNCRPALPDRRLLQLGPNALCHKLG